MTKKNRSVLFVTSEIMPFSKTGGLADISAALPRALAGQHWNVRVLTPLYGFIDRDKFKLRLVENLPQIPIDIHGRTIPVHLWRTEGDEGLELLFVECAPLYDRPGIYVDPFTNRDYLDNDYRYILLCRVAMRLCETPEFAPDIVHANDWQSALLPFYLNRARLTGNFSKLRSLLTIHNVAYHGLFGAETAGRIGGAEEFYYPGGPLEFYGHVNFLKTGLLFADELNTVSPTYALEIQSGYEYGYGLDGVLRSRGPSLSGILNGIDTEVWNPATDHFLECLYSAATIEKKE